MKRFIQQNPAAYTKYATVFYENLTDVTQVVAHVKSLREAGDIEAARQLALKNRDRVAYSTVYNRTQRKISKINKAITAVYNNRDMTRKQKREEIERLRQMKNAMMKMAVERMPIR